MKIKLVTVGKLKEKYLIQGINEYLKRLNSYAKMEIIEVPDEKAPEKLSDAEMLQVKEKEGQRILGKTFVIGGSLGLSDSVLQRSNQQISFGRLTYPHQLMRLVLVEQIYRGFRIMKGEPYHK